MLHTCITMRCSLLVLCVLAPVLAVKRGVIDDEYILRLDENLIQTDSQEEDVVSRLTTNYNAELIKFFHMGPLKLLYIHASDADAVRIRELTEVRYIEQNAYAYAAQCQEQPSPGTWGLDRIDQRTQLPYSNPTSVSATYIYGSRTGSDVVAYICDTGVEHSDPAFEGRASWGYTAIGMEVDRDLNGHGTHCAGTVGSAPYGVAKNVSLVAVKVLDATASGPWSSIIDGLDWIRADHEARQASAGGVMPKSVVNLSVGGGTYNPVDNAVENLIDAGVVVVIAAMNEDDNACNYSPARTPAALTIGASDVTDWSATFTNWGTCVDLFGPGVDVLSTHLNGDTAVYSGTSMATPHVAGVVARYQGSQTTAPTPQDVESWLLAQATQDALSFQSPSHALSPNLLLYTNC